MGFSIKKVVKSATKAVKKVVNSDVGKVLNPYNAIASDALGIKQSDAYAIGGTMGSAMFLNSLLNVGGLSSSSGSSDGSGGLLSSIFTSDGLLGSVVKGAVGLGADYLSSQFNTKQQYKMNSALADEAYQRDVAMWNLQNAYNAPKAQMERLQQAGLNPNLVYGSGNVTGNTAGSPPSYPQYSVQANKIDLARNILGIFNEYQQIKNQALENQRRDVMIGLRAEALRLTERRLDRQDRDAERRFQIMMANLGIQKDRNRGPIRKAVDDVKDVGSTILDWLGVGNGVSPELF